MFEKIVLRTSQDGPALTIGKIAELALFYQNVHLILDYRNLKCLLKGASPSTFLSFLGRESISATYYLDMPATHTVENEPLKTHNFVSIKYSGSETKGKISGFSDRVIDTFKDVGCTGKEAKDFGRQFCTLSSHQTLTDNNSIEGGMIEASKKILNQTDYINEAVRLELKQKTGEEVLPHNMCFQIGQSDEGFSVFSNIDFDEVNKKNKTLDPLGGKVTEASLINTVLTAESDMLLASNYGGDFYTSNIASTLIRMRFSSLLEKITKETNQIESFSETILESKTISEAIDSGEKTFDEYLQLLDEAEKFREWIKGQDLDRNLITEYCKELSNKGWIGNLPAKILRYTVAIGAGTADFTVGAGTSAFNDFLIEKILGGWKPSHFIEGSYKRFVE